MFPGMNDLPLSQHVETLNRMESDMKGDVRGKKRPLNEVASMRQKIADLRRSRAELAQAKKLLQKERETFFSILHKAPYGVILADQDGSFLYINPAFTRITGYTIEDIHAEQDWFHQASVFRTYSKEILKVWKKVVLKKGLDRILTVFCKEGEIKQVEFKPAVLDEGRMIIMLADVTERKRAEEELERYRDHLEERVAARTAELQKANEQLQREIAERKRVEDQIKRLNEDLTRRATDLEAANKELEAFSYSVSHDLRAPLIGILGFSRRLLDKYVQQFDQKGWQFLSIIQKDAQKMLQLVDNLMALSRFKHREMTPSLIDMEEMARTVFEELKRISPDTPDRLPQLRVGSLRPAYGDSTMVRQVFFNLLSNAIKFSRPREQGVIEIGYLDGEGQTAYYIKDNGVGFDMQHADKLFGVFQRLHGTREFEGTGIGLAIVQRIIHRQGGKVWAEGEVDKGATFYFTLPRSP
jgi:PAS domain S-box-containing protein